MEEIRFKSKIDWWVYAVVVFTVACCFFGPALSGDWLLGAIISVPFAILEIFAFSSVRYVIKGDKLGLRFFFKWEWFPICEIKEVRDINSILSAPALSTKRLAIYFINNFAILKGHSPLEISPADKKAFIAALKSINPAIKSVLS